jgi:hypothetical protein
VRALQWPLLAYVLEDEEGAIHQLGTNRQPQTCAHTAERESDWNQMFCSVLANLFLLLTQISLHRNTVQDRAKMRFVGRAALSNIHSTVFVLNSIASVHAYARPGLGARGLAPLKQELSCC